MKFIGFVAVVVLGWLAYGRMTATITYPPGVLIPAEPSQSALRPTDADFDSGAFHLKPLACFELDARVLHRKIYRYDKQAALVPVDLAVGWGAMSDQAVLDRLQISQSARFFWYEWQHNPPPIPQNEIIAHATNLHLIPATPAIAKACRALRTGELIHLRGLLVEANGSDMGTWRSSLSRTDSGNGACELVWVEELHDLER